MSHPRGRVATKLPPHRCGGRGRGRPLVRGADVAQGTCAYRKGCTRPAKVRGFCGSHYESARKAGTIRPLAPVSSSERFWRLVDKSRGPDACWPWMGEIKNNGYGRFWHSERDRPYAHRRAYELTHGAIAARLDIDHQCHNADASCTEGWDCPHRRCCNPSHLRAVSRSVNLTAGRATRGRRHKRRTHCKRGHRMTTRNTYTGPDGRYRQCVTCNRSRAARHGQSVTNGGSNGTEE